MKIRSILNNLILSATTVALIASCSGGKHDDHHGHDHEAEHASGTTTEDAAGPQFEVAAEFQNQLANVFNSYVDLKDALVASNAESAQAGAKETDEALANVDMKLLTGAAHNDWMTYLAPMQTALKEMQSASDIEVQRQAFSDLSNNLYKSVKAFGLGGKEAFYEYCPMAFNDEGAYWLSDQEKIRNPYFGDKMLTCGMVKEKLK